MIRLACFFALIALAALAPILMHVDGATAVIMSFVGYPALGLALFLYGVARWRSGAFRISAPSIRDRS